MGTLRFIDLFAGIGGIRKGFELACEEKGIKPVCVFTSEIKEHAITVLKQNHPEDEITGDITKVDAADIPDFDVLLGGFPCQAFSSAGKRLGFEDTRGTLFFDVARILKTKQPLGFVLENVEGLVKHDLQDKKAPIGKTLATILTTLDEIGYKTSWRVLNAKDFGVPQDRKRVYLVGTKYSAPDLDGFKKTHNALGTIFEKGVKKTNTPFTQKLMSTYAPDELYGKSIKDKRGGDDNIHSWDLGVKGQVNSTQKRLLDLLLKERRKKKWAQEIGIRWMDGMPLTTAQIATFFDCKNLQQHLDDLERKGYVVFEHPKQRVGNIRVPDESLPKGYNIVAGKLSFEVNKILDPNGYAPTLVAMDMHKIHVIDGEILRPLTLREGLRLFGYPEDFRFDISAKEGYDLLGNTVVVPVIKAVSCRLLGAMESRNEADSATNLRQTAQ